MSNSTIPSTWAFTTLGSVIEYGRVNKAEPNEIEDTAWILELEDIEKNTSKLLARISFADRQSKSTKNRFEPGDVLYGKLRPYLNKVIIADNPGYCTTEIIPLRAGDYLDNRYLFYWLKHPVFLDYVEAESHGLNMPRLGTETGRAAPFVLAPRNEQKRIADKLDTLLAQVDTCRDRLDRIPGILKRFRQSVLVAATSGALTVEWREQDGLAREDWVNTSLGSLVITSANGLSKRHGDSGIETTVLRLADFRNSERVHGGERTIQLDEKEINKYKLINNDLLVVRVNGSADLAGKFIKYEQRSANIEAYCDHFIRLRLDLTKITPEYALFTANSGAGRSYLESVLVTSAGQNTINQTSLFGLNILLPSIEEQSEIVRRVETLFAYADRLEARYKTARTQVEKLTPSLLAKAFRGELTADWRLQNPELIRGENSAEALLAKIQAERKIDKPKKHTKATKI